MSACLSSITVAFPGDCEAGQEVRVKIFSLNPVYLPVSTGQEIEFALIPNRFGSFIYDFPSGFISPYFCRAVFWSSLWPSALTDCATP